MTTGKKKPALKFADGIVATADEQARISQVIASAFAGRGGEETMKWLEKLTIRRAIEAFDEENKRVVSDAELWQQEVMGKLVALIRARIAHGHATKQ